MIDAEDLNDGIQGASRVPAACIGSIEVRPLWDVRGQIRFWLLVGLASHATMRIWSALHFIAKALAFERADPVTVAEGAARRWTRRSLWRFRWMW